MLKRLLPLLALLLLVLPGCAGKKTATAELPPEDYTLTQPANWRFIPVGKLPTQLHEMEKTGMTLLGGYTASPDGEPRFPMIVITRWDLMKFPLSGMLVMSDNFERFLGLRRAKSNPLLVNSKFFDEMNQRLFVDTTFLDEDGDATRVFLNMLFTEKGMLIAYGYTADSDIQSQAEMRGIMDSITLSPELRYQPIVTK
ncbi:hypothetical protein BerOc1_02026 [Pseudodesulfovibrio hydrargyri]|uniref:DUF1795 domain-containing protein n=1 Tax=Pseudodesulfovibrio hydrargyri TaxID=2125990 RepID=A0A1J5N5J5_9BACT|nr:hypothetical protein [Pseudodesulfovibrio hydrargyri]OIQ50096.1 hypothetical protein BerOc1_02026 [Pseudodesulfovibrio hydrargyri]